MKQLLMTTGVVTAALNSQPPLSQTTQGEVGLSYTVPFLQQGKGLISAQALRTNAQSCFESDTGFGRNVGKYSNLSGCPFAIGFYKLTKKVKGLTLGALIRNAQTGTQPQEGGYEEAYFFNFIPGSVAVKYYPFSSNNVFVKGDLGLASVLTKNRFENRRGEQKFFHQFGTGPGASISVGYSLTPLQNKSKSLELQATYQQLRTRVEVNGTGDDQWRFGALHLSFILIF